MKQKVNDSALAWLGPEELAQLRREALTSTHASNWKEAVERWKIALEAGHDAFESCYRLAEALLHSGQPDRAASLAAISHDLRADDTRPLALLGRSAMAVRDYAAAHTAWDKVLSLEPNHGEAWRCLRQCEELLGRNVPVGPGESTDLIDTEGCVDALFQSARALHAGGLWAEAEVIWRRLCLEREEDFEARFCLAQALLRQHQSNFAVAVLGELRVLNPAHGQTVIELVSALHSLERRHQAIRVWRDFKATCPLVAAEFETEVEGLLATQHEGRAPNPSCTTREVLAAARSRFATGRYDEAAACVESGLEQTPQDVDLLRLAARVAWARKRWLASRQYWQRLRRIVCDDFEALFQSGEASARLGELDAAVEFLDAAMVAPGVEARAAELLVEVLLRQDRMREARTRLRQGLRLFPTAPGLWGAGFHALRSQGRAAVADRLIRLCESAARGGHIAELQFPELLICAGRLSEARSRLRCLMGDAKVRAQATARLVALEVDVGCFTRAEQLLAEFETSSIPPAAKAACSELEQVRAFERRIAAPGLFDGPGDRFPAAIVAAAAVQPLQANTEYDTVLHLVHSVGPGSGEGQVATLAKAQARTWGDAAEVRIVRCDPGTSGQPDVFAPEVEAAGVRTESAAELARRAGEYRIPILSDAPGTLRALLDLDKIEQLVAIMCYLRPTVIHAWSPEVSAHAALAALLAGVPGINLQLASVAPDRKYGLTELDGLRHDWLRRTLTATLTNRRVMLVSDCRASLNEWVRWLGLPRPCFRTQTEVVPNMLDLDRFRPVDQRARDALAKRLDIPRGAQVVGTVMRLEPEKGVDTWIEAAALVAQRHPNVMFILAGGGPLSEIAAIRFEGAGLGGRVRLLGALADELPEVFDLMDVFLLSSHLEGVPDGLLEAQFYGVPVVAPAVGGVPEALVTGRTGLLCPNANGACLADQVSQLLDDDAARRRMGAAGPVFVKSLFTVENATNHYREIYQTSIDRMSCPTKN